MPAEFLHPAKFSPNDCDITSILESLAISTPCSLFPYVLLNVNPKDLKQLGGVGSDLVDPWDAAPEPLEWRNRVPPISDQRCNDGCHMVR